MKSDKTNKNRREFLKKSGVLLGVGATATSLSSLIISCKDETIPLPPSDATYNIEVKDYPELLVVDSVLKCLAKNSNDPNTTLSVIIRVLQDDKFIIVQHNCTHQGDQELPASINNDGNIICPRHRATYSMLQATPGELVANPNNVNATDLKLYKYNYKKAKGVIEISLK